MALSLSLLCKSSNSRSLCPRLFVWFSLCTVLFSDRSLGDVKGLFLDAPRDVFSDDKDLGRLPIVEVALVLLLLMQVVEPLVDLTPSEASVSDCGARRLLTHIDAFFFVELMHNCDLLLGLFESESSALLLGLFHYLGNFLRWGELSNFRVQILSAIFFSIYDVFQIARSIVMFCSFC